MRRRRRRGARAIRGAFDRSSARSASRPRPAWPHRILLTNFLPHLHTGPATPTYHYIHDKLFTPGVPSPPQEPRLAQATPPQARRRAPAPSSHPGSGAPCRPPQRATTTSTSTKSNDVEHQGRQGIQGQRRITDLAANRSDLHCTSSHQTTMEDQPGAVPSATGATTTGAVPSRPGSRPLED